MPRKQKQWKPLHGVVDHSSFIVPPKKSRAVQIKEPPNHRLLVEPGLTVDHLHNSGDGPRIDTFTYDGGQTSGIASADGLRQVKDDPSLQTDIAVERSKGQNGSIEFPTYQQDEPSSTSQPASIRTPGSTNHLNGRVSVPPPSNGIDTKVGQQGQEGSNSKSTPASSSSSHRGTPTRSNLDIYAYKYIPFWQRAVNESPAAPIYSLPLQSIDFDVYRQSFAALKLLPPLPEVILPPTLPCQIYTNTVRPQSYEQFWKERLHNEYAAQHLQNLSYGLYSHEIREYNKSQCLYKVKIPGIREYAPRIDLGDILLIRTLHPILEEVIAQQAQQWSQRRDGLAPGFSGIEHHAVVWSIMRKDELVILRLGKLLEGPPHTLRCNVIIPSQAHKNAPAWRAIDLAASKLHDGSSRLWLHSMLFPDANDNVLQENLWNGLFGLEWYDESLNTEQKKAVQGVIDNNYGFLPYLISGPPGTGKTKTLVEAAMQLITSRQTKDVKPHVLICAPSDAAADTLLVRLSAHLLPEKLFRLNNWTRLVSEVPGEVRSYCFVDENNGLHSLPSFEKLMSYEIVVTSCRDANMLLDASLDNDSLSTMTSSLLCAIAPAAAEKASLIHWTALLLDEAAQATEPETLIPIAVVRPADLPGNAQGCQPQLIMAGDEYQLGPRLFSASIRTTSANIPNGQQDLPITTPQLDISLFQRLFERTVYSAHPLSRRHGIKGLKQDMLPIPRPAFSNLIRNYRSHRAILTTSSHLFYADTLITERPHASPQILSSPCWPSKHRNVWPVMFLQNTSADRVESVLDGDGTGAGSLVNFGEASIALDIVTDLLGWVNHHHPGQKQHINHFDANGNGTHDTLHQEDIIIMSPFRAQVNHLRTLFRSQNLHAVRIGPLEAFQGLESRIVILCTTRTRLGQHPSAPRKFVDEDRSRGLGVIGEEKRFNVAMTRAKEGLVVVGSAECLGVTRDRCWIEFLAFVKRNGLVAGENMPGHLGREGRTGNGMVMRGKLERALLWAEGLAEGEDGGNEEVMVRKPYNADVGRTNGKGNGGFRLRGNMADMEDGMLEMQIGGRDEEMMRREEDEAFDDDDYENGDDAEDEYNGADGREQVEDEENEEHEVHQRYEVNGNGDEGFSTTRQELGMESD